MRERQKFELIVVGMGPVGAVAANLAGKSGLSTLVIEKALEPYDTPRAIVFDSEIMRVFDSIGLAEAIAPITRPLHGSVHLGADRAPIRIYRAPSRLHDEAWYANNIFYQPQLEAILREGLERFPNVEVRLGSELKAIRTCEDAAVLTIIGADGVETEVEADFTLACDGASSPTRKALGIALNDIAFEERWLVVDTFVNGPMRWPADHVLPEEVRDGRFSLIAYDPTRPATLIPGVGRHRRWEYMLLPSEHPDDVVPEEWLREQLSRWVDPANVEIVRAAVYRFRGLIANRWRQDRVFLVGDAAHQTPPFFGQGMCHGIRDVAQLMWKLKLVQEGVADPAIFDTYQAEREPHVREIISASVEQGAQICTLDLDEARARDADVRMREAAHVGPPVALIDVVPPLRDGVMDRTTGGARIPDFAFITAAGGAQRIDDLLAGRIGVLSLDTPPVTLPATTLPVARINVGAEGALADQDGQLAAWFAERRARYAIVRPDRYLHSTARDSVDLLRQFALLCSQLGIVDEG